MKNTPALRKWVQANLYQRGWNQVELAEATRITGATWSRFFSRKYKHLAPTTVTALCRVFGVSEIALFQIAQGIPHDPEINSVSAWLRDQSDTTRKAILRTATRHGWQSESNHFGKPLQINAR